MSSSQLSSAMGIVTAQVPGGRGRYVAVRHWTRRPPLTVVVVEGTNDGVVRRLGSDDEVVHSDDVVPLQGRGRDGGEGKVGEGMEGEGWRGPSCQEVVQQATRPNSRACLRLPT